MIDIARDELLRLEDVARRFGMRRTAIANWVRSGKLEARKVGGAWFTTPEALNDMAERETQRSVRHVVTVAQRNDAAIRALEVHQVEKARLAVAIDNGVAALARHGVSAAR